MIKVGIVGASGYSGSVCARLVAGHPRARLIFATSDRLAGQSVGESLGIRAEHDIAYAPNVEAASLAAKVDAVVLATSAEVSAGLAPALADAGKLVIDLSGAFRLPDPADYPRFYGFEHPAPNHLAGAHYGLPELFGPPPKASGIVANPGCYATAAQLAVAPLLRAGLAQTAHVIVDGKSGVSGAGRRSQEAYSFVEVNEDVRAYKVLGHQHAPEIARGVSRAAGAPVRVTFTPHLVPINRGLLVTAYMRPAGGASAQSVQDALRAAYEGKPFVRVVAPDRASVHSVAGTNVAAVGATADGDVVIAACALDNLVKGAAGQAMQNLNLAHGLPETLGLDGLVRFAP